MKILIINNASLVSDKLKAQNELFREAAKLLEVDVEFRLNTEINYYFDESGEHIENLDCDCILFYDKDKVLAQVLKKNGYKLFNNYECINNCDNKAETYRILSENGLPIPKTLVFPTMFFERESIIENFSKKLTNELKFPVIAKKWFGSEGQQVFLLNDINEVKNFIKQEKQEILFQEYFEECFGRDIRINIVGDAVKSCIERISNNDFRSNLSNGGRAVKYEPTDVEKQLALNAAKALGCKFCGVDILQTDKGPVICEVNSNPFFINTFNAIGTNLAIDLIAYLKSIV